MVTEVPELVPRHELWRIRYRETRYLQHASHDDLQQRCQDVGANIIFLTDDGAIAPTPVLGPGPPWWEYFTEILEELALRGVDPRSIDHFNREMIDRWFAHSPPRGAEVMAGVSLPGQPYLVKIGRREHIEPMFEAGRVRIAPASSYGDASLNSAVRDDELSIAAARSATLTKAHWIDPKAGITSSPIPLLGEIRYSVRMKGNYYVFCLAQIYGARLLDDFEGNAVLLITDPDAFTARLRKAVKAARADLDLIAGPVRYYDPYFVKPTGAFVPMLKHFRYAYQNEFRFAWTSTAKTPEWDEFFIELGPLTDCATYHALP